MTMYKYCIVYIGRNGCGGFGPLTFSVSSYVVHETSLPFQHARLSRILFFSADMLTKCLVLRSRYYYYSAFINKRNLVTKINT